VHVEAIARRELGKWEKAKAQRKSE
jgi:hypothetical protein